MRLSPIIISLLDTDLYKFNMNQVKVSRELTKIKMKIKESM